jgi:putative phage-type endonuclease
VADVMAKTKTGYSASRENYMHELLVQRLTGEPAESYCSSAMQWGIDMEPEAIAYFEYLTGATVTPVGFIDHPEIKNFGASPDGLVWDALIEVKCPDTKTHLDYLLNDKIPTKYQLQMTSQMACTGRAGCYFASYDPRLPDNLKMFIKYFSLDKTLERDILDEVQRFLEELDILEERVRGIV